MGKFLKIVGGAFIVALGTCVVTVAGAATAKCVNKAIKECAEPNVVVKKVSRTILLKRRKNGDEPEDDQTEEPVVQVEEPEVVKAEEPKKEVKNSRRKKKETKEESEIQNDVSTVPDSPDGEEISA
jgi:hypothetical protein